MTPEKQFENDLVKTLVKKGVFAHHFDAIGCDGFPDVVALGGNSCVLVECKHETTSRRTEQIAFSLRMSQTFAFNKMMTVCKMTHKRCYYVFWTDIPESIVCTTVGQVADAIIRTLRSQD